MHLEMAKSYTIPLLWQNYGGKEIQMLLRMIKLTNGTVYFYTIWTHGPKAAVKGQYMKQKKSALQCIFWKKIKSTVAKVSHTFIDATRVCWRKNRLDSESPW